MIAKILQAQDPKLREISKPVPKLDKKVISLIKDLKDTLSIQKDPEGVGLAAPQIGKNVQVFVMLDDKKIRTIVNPIVVKGGKKDKSEVKKTRARKILEGCLSVPHFYGPLEREKSITIKYLAEDGSEVTEEFIGFNAQIVQHEIDHLNGILFIDRLLEQKKPLYKLNGKEWEEVEI